MQPMWRSDGLVRSGLAVLIAVGCGSAMGCDCGREDGEPIVYAGGLSSETRYQSSELYGIWLDYPAGRRYQLLHALPEAPTDISVYLAFQEDPLHEGRPGNIAPASGNAALIEAVSEKMIQVRNDTCSDFHVRVVADLAPAADADDTQD